MNATTSGVTPRPLTDELEESDRVASARFYSALGSGLFPAIERIFASERAQRVGRALSMIGSVGASSWRSCSWCDTLNELLPGEAVFCRVCGHRADLPRMECDCGEPGCLGWWPVPQLEAADLWCSTHGEPGHMAGSPACERETRRALESEREFQTWRARNGRDDSEASRLEFADPGEPR